MADKPYEYDLTEADLEGMTPVASVPESNDSDFISLDPSDLEGMTPVDLAPAENDEGWLDTAADTAKAGGAGVANAILGMGDAVWRTPDAMKRGYGALYSLAFDKELPDEYNPFSYISDGFSIGDTRIGGTTGAADMIGDAQQQLPGMSETFANVAKAGQEADKAFDEALGGEFTRLGQVVTDPEAWSAMIGQAIPSLYAAYKSGGSMPFMAWLEGMEQAKSASDFEERTGQKIDDETYAAAVTATGMINGLLEKTGLDAILRGNGSLARRFFGGMIGEAATEGSQAFTGNAVQKYMYDPDASLTEGILPGMMGGAGTGGPAGFMSGLAQKMSPPKDNLDAIRKKVVDDIDIAQEEKGLLGLPEPTVVVTPDGVAATEANMRAAEEMGLRGTTMADTLGGPQIPGDGAVDFEQPDMTGIGAPERGTRGTGQFQNWEGNIPFEDQLSGEDSAMLADLRGMVTVARNAGDKQAEAKAQAEVDNFLRNKLGGQDLSLTPLDNMTPIDGRVQPDNSIEFDQGDSYLDMDLDLPTDSTAADAQAPAVPPSGELVGQIDELRTAANETNSPFLKAKLNRDADLLQAKLDGEKPKLSKEEAARKRKEYDATEEPLDMLIRKMGGLDTELESDYAGRFGHLNEKGKKNIENPGRDKGGMTLDDLLERANQEGFDFKDKADLEEALSRIEQGESVYSSRRSSDSINYEALQNDRARLAQGEKLSPEDRALNETARLMDPDRYEKIIEPDDYKPSEKQIISELADRAMEHAPGQASYVMSQDMSDAETMELLQDILNNEPEPKPAGKDATVFKQPYQYKVDRYKMAADEEGLTPAQRKRFTPEDTRDDVTGMYKAEDRIPTMNRARDYVDANGTEGSYVDIDLRNLGGLNAEFSHTGANKHFKAFADIVSKHVANVGNTVTFRHGGDEMSVIAPDVGVDDMTAVMAAAQAEINQYVQDNGLADLPHAKYEGASAELQEISKGTGIYFGVSMIDTDVTNSEIIQLAEEQTEAQKPKKLMALMQEEKSDVNQQTTETTGTGQDEPGAGTERTGDPDTEGQGPGTGEAAGTKSAAEIAAADSNDLIEKARSGDKDAQAQLEKFGLGWDGDKQKYRLASKGEIDKVLSGEKVESDRGHGYTDITDNKDYANVPADSNYRITFKKSEKFDSDAGKDTRLKNEKAGEYQLDNGYSIDDVQTIEQRQADGSWIVIHRSTDGGFTPLPGSKSADEISAAAAEATGHEASEAQINAGNNGNFKKGHLFNMQGFKISIENNAGTKRNKMTPKSWPPLAHHYGDLTGTTGADGDPIDVFIKQGADIAADHPIYVINQKNKDGSFDEHKVMMGFDSEADAKQGYLDSYSDDFTGFDGIVETTAAELREWADSGDMSQPFASAADMVAAPAEESGAQGNTEAAPDDFNLESQTESDIAAAEKAEAEAQQQEQEADRKAEADAQVDDFTLAGSDSAVDQAEARGQQNMFDQKPVEADAVAILDVANVTGKDRLDIMAKYRSGEYTLDDLKAAYPATESSPDQEAVATESGVSLVERDITFETGKPVSFTYLRNTEKAPDMGSQFQQDIEPSGRYMTHKSPVVEAEAPWEAGEISFSNPIVMPVNTSPDSIYDENSWKVRLSEEFGGKTGVALSKAIAKKGYDAIITVDLGRNGEPRNTSEIVDLTSFANNSKQKAAPENKIDDFGEKIDGARKDVWQAYAQSIDNAKERDVTLEPLSKSWPEPNYQKMIDDGADPWLVGAIRSIRDEVPAKPRQKWKLKQWGEMVTSLRDFSTMLANGDLTAENLKRALGRSNQTLKDNITGRIELYQIAGHDKSLRGVKLGYHHYAIYKGEKNVDRWTVEKKAKASGFSNWPDEIAAGKTKDEALENFKQAVEYGELNKPKSKNVRFEIYRYRSGNKAGKWFIGKKVGRNYIDLESFDDSGSARKFLNENQMELEDKLDKFKQIPDHRKENNSPRVGVNHRENLSFLNALIQRIIDRGDIAADSISNTLIAHAGGSKLPGFFDVPFESVPLARGSDNMDSSLYESPAYRLLVLSKFLGNLNDTNALSVKGFASLDVPGKRLVQSSMLSIGHNPQVRRSVIELIPVDVMNDLIGTKFSADGLLSDKAMLGDGLSIDRKVPIGGPNPSVLAFVRAVASVTAEVSFTDNVARVALKDDPAVLAGKFDSVLGEFSAYSQDVTPQDFMDAFSFSGVQFGNYVEQSKRQQDLNQAYDALMDLAGIINVPSKALSLNGELGLAFGARGKGKEGNITPAAHYESGHIVINLTKKAGAGSLAHEWFHSLDNYFSRARGEKNEFLTERSYPRGEGVRPEVVEAFDVISKTINKTGLKQRSMRLDKGKSKEYWQTGREMSARAFESYVIEKLKDNNQSNDYLANIVGEDYWNAAAALGIEKENTYPYPEAAEIPEVRAAFDNFFRVVDTKETDSGIMLFSKRNRIPGQAGQAAGITEAEAVSAIEQFEKELGNPETIDIVTAPTKESIMHPDALREVGNDQVKGYYVDRSEADGGGAIVLILEDLDSVADAIETLRHEWVVHHGLNTFNAKNKRKIINRIMSSKGEMSLKKAWQHVKENYSEYPAEKQAEEMLAYMAENKATRMSKLWNDLVLMVQNMLKKLGLMDKNRTTKADVIQFIEDLSVRVGKGAKQQTFDGETSYSKQAVDVTETDSFKRWFADSKVVDENGDPLVVYHGGHFEADSFTSFDKELTDVENDLGAGFYFSSSKSDAEGYDYNLEYGAPQTLAVYLSIQNPYVIGKTKKPPGINEEAGEVFRDAVEEAGYDGIIDGEVNTKFAFEGYTPDATHYVVFNPSQIKSADNNNGQFDPNNADIMYSKRAGKAVSAIDQRAKGAAATVKHFIRRNLTKEGLMPDSAFEFKIGMDSEKNVGESEISFMVAQFQDDVAKSYGKKYNKLTPTELEEINGYLAGQKGVALPEGLHRKLDHMRAYLDRLSGGMQEAMVDMLKIEADQLSDSQAEAFGMYMATEGAEGYIPKSLQKHWNLYQTIEKNKGTYLTRSYEAFDDENWKNKVMMNHDLMRRAKEYIAQQSPELTPSEVHGAVGAILESAYENGNFMSFMVNGSKAGSKDTSIITKRKDVPPIIRELLGEYKDPKVNFTRSATKMQYFVANHHFLMGLRNDGMGTWLFERPTGEYDAQIAGEQSETMNPLNGLYTSRDIKQGLADASGAEPVGDVMRELIRFNSMVKYGKTIIAPTTQVRNFISAGMFTVMNGHFDYSHLQKAFGVARSDLFTKEAEWKTYINRLVGLGVLHNNPRAGELKDALQDFIEMDIYKQGALQIPKKILDFAQRSYQLGDDFWKVVGYENELQRQLDTGLSQAEAEKKAAYRIRNGYPTYSMVPRGIKKIRRWPLIGTFVSFPYEITRTSYNQAQFLKEDIAAGNTKAAAQRAVGISIAVSAAYAASVASMLLMGIDDDDDEAVRKLLPPWSRNSQLIYTGFDENGSPTYYDLSYVDPYTYLKKPISALMNGNNEGIDEKLMDASMEYLEPFIGIDIAAGVALEIASNKRMGTGSPIYNEQADSWDKTKAILEHVRKGLQPGVMSNAERIILALNEQSSRSGRKYELGDEMWALAGQRFGTLNIPQSMVYKSFQFSEDKAQASMLLSYVSGSGQKISESEVRDATNSMLEARGRVYKDMIKLVGAARRLGMSDDDLADIMEASGISRDDTDYLLDGEVAPWDMPFSYGERAYTRSMLTAHDDARRAEIEAEMDRRLDIIDEILDEHYK